MLLSVIIASHCRPDSLARLLSSLIAQFDPLQHELFVAENGTVAPLPLQEPGFPIIHLHDSRSGKCRIQNRAIAQARGEIIACLDDDVVVTSDYLLQVERFFSQYPEFAAMKGRVLALEDPSSKAGVMAPYLDLPLVDHGEAVAEVRGVIGANMAFRTAALRAIGGFDERLGPGAGGHEEETEISRRLRKHGYRIGYAPGALVLHEVDPSRAVRDRFIRVARERGYCRTLHEHHSRVKVVLDIVIAWLRLRAAHALGLSIVRIAREERRLAVAQGMADSFR